MDTLELHGSNGFSRKTAHAAPADTFITVSREIFFETARLTFINEGLLVNKTELIEHRTGRNPRTGDAIKIKAAKVPKFRPGKALKDALN
ncbi:MAG: hypothetical protein B7Y54_14935 [Polaromonas sp. 35-63-240]|nr:MAG: hypothetical protein B7Y54_14935 [Polaromonas sp. 35-63-240]